MTNALLRQVQKKKSEILGVTKFICEKHPVIVFFLQNYQKIDTENSYMGGGGLGFDFETNILFKVDVHACVFGVLYTKIVRKYLLEHKD